MKAVADASSLSTAMQYCMNAVEKRTTIPILSHVLLSSDTNGMSMRASDLELEIECPVHGALATNAGAMAIPAEIFMSQIRFASGEVTLSAADHQRLLFQCGRSRSRIPALLASEFTQRTVDIDEDCVAWDIPAQDFIFLLEHTAMAAAPNALGKTPDAVNLTGDGSTLEAAATDDARISVATAEVAVTGQVMLPIRAAKFFLKTARQEGKDVQLRVAENAVEFKCGGVTAKTQLTSRTFPNYRRVLPNVEEMHPITFRTAELSEVLQAAGPFADRSPIAPIVNISIGDGGLTISANHPSRGEFSSSIEIDGSCPDVTFGMNPSNITPFLSAHEEQNSTMFIKDAKRGIELRPANGQSSAWRYLAAPCMPK